MIVYKTGFVYDHWTSSDTVKWLGSSSGNGFVQNFICRIPRVILGKRRTFPLFREQTAVCKLRRCFKFFAEGNCVVKADVKELFLIHEDDSRMLLHVNYIPAPSDIVTRTVDTDVLIIALGIMDQLDRRKMLWLESKGKTRYDTFRSRKSSKILAKSYRDPCWLSTLWLAVTILPRSAEKERRVR